MLWVALGACLGPVSRAADTNNSLVWLADHNQVSADIHNESLWPLLEDIAHQTGWHIFVEPTARHTASVKFANLPAGAALHKLLGSLNYALVPQTNGPQELYVFTTTIHNATRRVAGATARPPARHVANQLMVKVKPGTDIDALAKARGAKVVARNDKLGIYLLEFSDASATDAALASLKADPSVASVDYNYLFDAPVAAQPLANAPASAALPSLSLDSNAQSDSCTPVIGLIDTGIQSLGNQLDQFIQTNINVSGSDPNLSSTTPTHGTAMAQAMLSALSQNSSNKKSGVKIVAVDVYGNNETATSYNVALGVQAAVDNGATVLNMSLAGSTDGQVLDDIIQQALAQGVVVFAAAGNQPVDTPFYPAAIPGVMSVTALGAPGQLASYADYASSVDMALPGSSYAFLGDQTYIVNGTSPATAYASGVAAGAKAQNCASWSSIETGMEQKFPVPATGN